MIILPDGEYPEWVLRVEAEIGTIMLPLAKVKDVKALTPKSMGALLGHACAVAVWMIELVFESAKRAEIEAQNATQDHSLKTGERPDKVSLDEWYSGMRRIAKVALCSSVDQDYEAMSGFLIGFSAGFARKPKSLKIGDIGNTATEIYVFMWMFWRFVHQLKSVHELHEVLVKVLGAHKVGDLKRVEKICQRMGLHYRKPGRPAKVR